MIDDINKKIETSHLIESNIKENDIDLTKKDIKK